MVHRGIKCIRYIHFLSNVLFVIFSVVMIVAGTVTKTGYNKYNQFFDADILSGPPNLFIVAGSVMFLIALLGFCGAVDEKCCMPYYILVGLLLGMELAAGIIAFGLEDDVEQMVSTGMKNKMKDYHHNNTDVIKAWNIVQTSLECCGIDNYTDWMTAHDEKYILIPISCCKWKALDNCTQGINVGNIFNVSNAEAHIYIHGCRPKVVTDIAIARIGQIGIGLAVIELVGIFFACVIASSIPNSYEKV